MNSKLLPCLLQVRSLHFSYPHRHVFAGWSGEFKAGLTWLQGPNGCGKSTLLKLLAGALVPRHGQLSAAGVDQHSAPLDYRRQVFWCGPDAIAFDHLSPVEYWSFMRGLYPRLDQAALRQHALALGLAPHLAAPLRTLSSGTQRKVWISATLAAGTPVRLLDEPFNALDAASLQYLRQVLAEQARAAEVCWVLSSHEDLGEASPWAVCLDLSA
ncbi:ATP-binding cassette domain-containing protein [Rhodoferax sp.]|uniref:ABC transporter ATP-binding protein n=1 Tax=Rhodoferax sp. TaxID=50421 RepID=UPI002623190F|nr:ATP-binding cassette domain-containing protein [Rhodoferax sp.]MDD2925429.1 ATP-binding cassette domain-containing protein [Rhodoferax sp.]